jgi:2-polyprenyl-6-methoxyphenol hydroxylase-like FAD-dependent oxidoreductase
MTTALVIGAGVAGPVAAMALQKAGIHAEVNEAHPAGADEVGSWLTLQANGIDALRAVDAHRLVAGLGFPTATMRFVNGRGRLLGTMSNGAPLADGTGSQMLRRADLYRGLRDEAVARGATIRYGKQLVDATSEGGRVVARFADGTEAEGDLLVGCDGIRSRVRQVIDPAAPPARYVPVLNIGGYIPDFAVDTPTDEFQMMFGKRCFFGYTATPDGGVVWFANPPRADEPAEGELAAMSDGQWRTWLLELLADDRGPAREIVAAAPPPLSGWATYDMPTVRRWHRGHLIVIGDAAHATAPSAGQGAAMALEDAVVLAQCLRDLPDVPRAFAAFEQIRRDRVEKVVAQGARSSNSKAAGPIGRVVRDAVLPVIFRHAAKGGSSLRWMHGHHIDWDAPVVTPSGAPVG